MRLARAPPPRTQTATASRLRDARSRHHAPRQQQRESSSEGRRWARTPSPLKTFGSQRAVPPDVAGQHRRVCHKAEREQCGLAGSCGKATSAGISTRSSYRLVDLLEALLGVGEDHHGLVGEIRRKSGLHPASEAEARTA